MRLLRKNSKTHRTLLYFVQRRLPASMTPHVYDALSCLRVVGWRGSCWRSREPRGLLLCPQTLAFSWQAGLQVSAYRSRTVRTAQGMPTCPLAPNTPVKMGVRRKGVTVSLPRGSREGLRSAGRFRSDFQFCPETADCGPVTTLLWALFCSSVNWANSYINFHTLVTGTK